MEGGADDGRGQGDTGEEETLMGKGWGVTAVGQMGGGARL